MIPTLSPRPSAASARWRATPAARPGAAAVWRGAAPPNHTRRAIAHDLEGLAAVAGLQHAGRQALVYLGAAQALRNQNSGPLPPAERAILTRILDPALAPLTAWERQEALSEGRSQPLLAIITRAMRLANTNGGPTG